MLTTAEILDTQKRDAGHSLAIIDENGACLTYEQLHQKSYALASSIVQIAPLIDHRCGRIGILLPNGASLSVALLGVSLAGVAVPFNPNLTAAEYDRQFISTKITTLLVSDFEQGPSIAVAEAMSLPIIRLGSDISVLGASNNDAPFGLPKPSDTAVILMTSGSTGRPKIVPLTHANICLSSANVASSLSLTCDDLALVMWEQFHIGGLTDLLLAPLISGGAVLVTGGLDVRKFFILLNQYEPTWYQAVPTALAEIVSAATRQNLSCGSSSLRFVRSVAAALSPSLQELVESLFQVPVVCTLGMTEAAPLIATTSLSASVKKLGSVGRPAGPQVAILDPEGHPVSQGKKGQIGIRGETVFAGYDNYDDNKSAFIDGWFLTGDLGYFDDDGDLFLAGRLKEMFNRGGETINPQEIDDALMSHPLVQEAASFSISHPTLGEDIAAAIVLSSPLSTSAIKEFLVDRLAQFKIPSRFYVLETLPRTPVGKIDRLLLAQSCPDNGGESAGFKPPQTLIQETVAEIWKRELNIAYLGVDQDFVALGGDSLSTMRVFLAMEEAFGAILPDTILDQFTTIERISALIEAANIQVPNDEKSVDADNDSTACDVFPPPSSWRQLGTEAWKGGIEEFSQELSNCGSKREIKILTHKLETYATPAEIYKLIRGVRSRAAGSSLASISLWGRGFLLIYCSRWKRKTLKALSAAGQSTLRWQMEPLQEGVLHFSDPGVPSVSKSLIVGFSGKGLRLGLPTYRLLSCLDPSAYDLLLLRDVRQSLFLQGLPDIAEGLEGLGSYVDSFARAAGYTRVVAFGLSGGGFASVICALSLGWPLAVAVSPASIAKHPEFSSQFKALSRSELTRHTRLLVPHGFNERDRDAARQFSDLLPQVELSSWPELRNHNILADADSFGRLSSLVSGWLA